MPRSSGFAIRWSRVWGFAIPLFIVSFMALDCCFGGKENDYHSFSFFFRLNILVLSINTVSAAQKTTKMPKVIKVALGLCGA